MDINTRINNIRNRVLNKMFLKEKDDVDFLLILTLDIIIFEISQSNKISDYSASAITQLSAFQSVEYYKSKYPELDTDLMELASELRAYNQKLKNYEQDALGVSNKGWVKYFNESILKILNKQ